MKPDEIIPFLPAIETVVHSFLGRFDLSKRDEIQDKIVDKLLAIGYQETNPDKIKAKIITITKNECRDFLRLVRVYGQNILWGSPQLAQGAISTLRWMKRKCYEKRSRPQYIRVKSVLTKAGHRARAIKHLEIYQAWCNGMSRRQMAKKFMLSEDQIRGRLASVRKKVLLILNNSTTSK